MESQMASSEDLLTHRDDAEQESDSPTTDSNNNIGAPAAADRGEHEPRYKCEHCDKTFGRREHYKRHQNIHTGAKPFPCPLCPRSFPRKDTLQRHVLMHGKAGPEALPAKIRLRTSRACWPCAKSKMRCDGSNPCSRCQARGITCARRPASVEDDHGQNMSQSNIDSSLDGDDNTPQAHLSHVRFQPDDAMQWTSSHQLQPDSPSIRKSEPTVIAQENPNLVPPLPAATYVRMRQFWETCAPGLPPMSHTPSPEAMNVYIQLYFEHFHSSFPILHMPTFQPREDLWILVLAVAAIGAEYSELCTQETMEWFEELAKKAVDHVMTNEANRAGLPICQSVLLFDMLLYHSSSEENLLFLRYHASLLATLVRNLISRRIADDSHTDGPEVYLMRWSYFADIEQERRLICFSWFYESLVYLASGILPVMNAQELTRTLSCDETFWLGCKTEQEWLDMYQSAAPKKQSLAAVVAQPLTEETVEELGNSALIITYYTLLVERKRMTEADNVWFRSRLDTSTEDDTASLIAAIDDDMDTLYEGLQARLGRSATDDSFRSYFYLASIVKVASTDMLRLRLAAGIAAPQGMTANARKDLALIFSSKPVASRRALAYSAELFSMCRNGRIIPRWEVRMILTAALYISLWTRLSPSSRQQAGRGDVEIVQLGEERLDSPKVKEWIADDDVASGTRAYVEGIGVLHGPDAVIKALEESAKLLQSKASTSSLARHTASNLEYIAKHDD